MAVIVDNCHEQGYGPNFKNLDIEMTKISKIKKIQEQNQNELRGYSNMQKFKK